MLDGSVKQGRLDVLEALRHGKLGEKTLAGAGPAASDRKRIRWNKGARALAILR